MGGTILTTTRLGVLVYSRRILPAPYIEGGADSVFYSVLATPIPVGSKLPASPVLALLYGGRYVDIINSATRESSRLHGERHDSNRSIHLSLFPRFSTPLGQCLSSEESLASLFVFSS